jgi:hypothetical protein
MNGMFRAYDMLVDHLAHIDEAIKQMGKADDGFLRVIKDLRNKQKKEHAKLMDSLIWHWQRKNCEWCKCGWVWPSMSMVSSIVLSPVKDGRYVLYTDHLAETRKLIDTYDLLISQEDKKIAELEAENKRLREALKYIAFTTPGPTMKTHSEAAEQALKEASDPVPISWYNQQGTGV